AALSIYPLSLHDALPILIARADVFVIFDNRQYTKRDWRNRNRIKTSNGTHWLTIPIKSKGHQQQKINEAVVHNPSWMNKHLKSRSEEHTSELQSRENLVC